MPRHVVIAVPAYAPNGPGAVRDVIFRTLMEIGKRPGWGCTKAELGGNCMIPHARNTLVSDFLSGAENTDLIFWDDDNWCEPNDIFALLDAPADIVGAAVRSRREPMTWNVSWLQDQEIKRNAAGLIEVKRIGTGILRITRGALERMVEALKDDWYRDAGARSGIAWPLFEYLREANTWWGEDMVFCRRWRELGGKVYVHPDIVTHHIGAHDFSASLGGWLSSMPRHIEVVEGVPVANEAREAPAPKSSLEGDVPATGVDFASLPAEMKEAIAAAALAPPKTEPQGSVCVALPTRGRPTMLLEAVRKTLAGAELPSTHVVVGYDGDDRDSRRAADILFDQYEERVVRSVREREDSLGAKYNRCAVATWDPTLIIGGCDDTIIPTPGWDRKLLQAAAIFPDGIGVVYFGAIEGVFQPGLAITRRLVELQGYFVTDHFPYWWHDTWAHEIGMMIGRIVRATDVQVEAIGPINQSRGCRDVHFWATFFDETRCLRRDTAHKILQTPGFAADQAMIEAQIARWPEMEREFREMQAKLLDPNGAAEIERQFAHDAPADERYLRIKAKAEKLLADLVDTRRRVPFREAAE